MQKFHLTLYPTRWLLRKTSCLKIRGRLVKGNIICRKRSWTVAKQRKTAAVRNSAEQWANQENNCRDTPLSGKEKATPLRSAAETDLPPCFTNSKASFLSIASITILLPLLPLRFALSLLPLLSLRSALTVVFELLRLTWWSKFRS